MARVYHPCAGEQLSPRSTGGGAVTPADEARSRSRSADQHAGAGRGAPPCSRCRHARCCASGSPTQAREGRGMHHPGRRVTATGCSAGLRPGARPQNGLRRPASTSSLSSDAAAGEDVESPRGPHPHVPVVRQTVAVLAARTSPDTGPLRSRAGSVPHGVRRVARPPRPAAVEGSHQVICAACGRAVWLSADVDAPDERYTGPPSSPRSRPCPRSVAAPR